jgi:hypothetical protein
VPSGSFQNPTGIDGIGRVTTSSPTSSTTGFPLASQASSATPSSGAEISPAHTGVVGALPANPLTTSVPPVVEASWTVSATCSATQW